MKDYLKVSIITVCYNSEEYIEDAIKSVLIQTYKNIEYIIIDGESTDGTLDIVDRFKDKITKIISEKDKGIYDAMNKGIRISSGDVIYFLNSDDRLYDKNVICDIVKEFNDNNVGIIYGKVILKKVPLELLPYLKRHRVVKKKRDLLSKGICHQSLFAKKWVFDKVGLFNTQYKIAADYDWLLSSFNFLVKIKFIDRYIATYYYQGFNYQNLNRVKREKISIVYKKFPLTEFLFYYFRYILLRDLNSIRKNLLR